MDRPKDSPSGVDYPDRKVGERREYDVVDVMPLGARQL